MKLQVAVVQECDADKAATVRCICYHESKKSPLLFSLDSLWLEVSRMIADFAEAWDHINAPYHQYCVMRYMRAMKHPRAAADTVSISYRNFIMLALALDQDINAMGIHVSDLVAPIGGRVSVV